MEASHNGIPPGGLAATKAEVQTAENNAKAYADGLVVGLLDDRGNYDASVNTFPAAGGSGSAGAIKKGDVWLISVAGTLGGSAVEIGDMIRARIDTPGQTAGNWTITERNLGYVPENPANKDASGGYAGLTAFKINFKNAANTFMSFFTNTNTAARTYTFQDRDGTIADDTDLALKAPLASPTFTGTVTVPTPVSATDAATKGYADGLITGLYDDRGNYDASVNTFPASGGSGASGAVLKGDVWMVSVAGTLGGVAVNIGDIVRALIDTPGQTASNWALAEGNLGYTPQNIAEKDATGGYAGLTLFKINFKNAANTFTSFFTNTNTAARTYTFQDRDGTIADNADLALKAPLASPTFTGTVTVPTPFTLGATSVTATGAEINHVSGVTSAIQTQINSKAATNATVNLGTSSFALNRASAAQTVTGLFITPQLQTVANAGGTLTPAAITNDVVTASALSQNTTIAAPSGTPVDGEKLIIRLRDNGTSRTLTWNAIYRVVGANLPTSTGAPTNAWVYIVCIYNATDTKWDVIESLKE